jgi:hypothetical protein
VTPQQRDQQSNPYGHVQQWQSKGELESAVTGDSHPEAKGRRKKEESYREPGQATGNFLLRGGHWQLLHIVEFS